MSKPAVGVIGLGNIGRGVATNLGKPEHDVHVWDVAEPARAYFTGKPGFIVAPPAEMARTCEAILFVVPATPQIKACLDGDDGIVAHARDGLILVDLTTSDPLATRELAADLKPRGIHYIDAGASGGKQRADAGDLTLMVGGDADAVARAKPYLDAIAREVFHLGESGAGHTMKLVHNIICHANFMAAAEAFNVGERAGLKLADMVAVVNQSNGRSYITEQRFPNHILSQTWDGRSHVSNLHKDLTMGVELARRLGGGSEFSEATVRYLDQAMRRGMAAEDFTLIYRDFDAIRAMED
ncbi:MAG TPA: NAD(P)-dependent oxidoreductase [Pseudolabrys sp.]|nr:NAD(P)-dependent oxidoreductase [Pseudolabrys sp.]